MNDTAGPDQVALYTFNAKTGAATYFPDPQGNLSLLSLSVHSLGALGTTTQPLESDLGDPSDLLSRFDGPVGDDLGRHGPASRARSPGFARGSQAATLSQVRCCIP